MTQPPIGGTPAEHSSSSAPAPARGLLWPVTLLVLGTAALVLMFIGFQGNDVLLVAAWLLVLFTAGADVGLRRKRQRRYLARFPTLDDLRSHIDESALRALREEEGDVHAVRALRRQVPGLPLAEAAKLVKSL